MRRECDWVRHRQPFNMIKTYYKYLLILGSKSVVYDQRTRAVEASIFINQIVSLARPQKRAKKRYDFSRFLNL